MKDFVTTGGAPNEVIEIARELGCFQQFEPFERLAEERKSAITGKTSKKATTHRLKASEPAFSMIPSARPRARYASGPYGFERFLVRMAQSEWRDCLVLKRGMALVVTRTYARATRSMTMLGRREADAPPGADVTKIIVSDKPPTTIQWSPIPRSFKGEVIKSNAKEPGHQITGGAKLGSATIPLKIEISHGHVISPAPVKMSELRMSDGVKY
ncbi:hypothetical protein ABIA06_002974 [Bradyrhizobium yuanmingense]|uniref:hypothetical protein n=1 Tax=Bradyrhizobium yuanmingense TaxID=108015 RepID=UPI0035153D49